MSTIHRSEVEKFLFDEKKEGYDISLFKKLDSKILIEFSSYTGKKFTVIFDNASIIYIDEDEDQDEEENDYPWPLIGFNSDQLEHGWKFVLNAGHIEISFSSSWPAFITN